MSSIVIRGYDPDWPAAFEALRARLSRALGPLAVRIDHIGSTAVPGMGAKDIVDVQVTVAAFASPIDAALAAAGFVCVADIRADHVPFGADPAPALWEKRLYRDPPPARPANVHVRLAGNPNQRYPLLFRDYLRAHPHAAGSVVIIKQQLARHLGHDVAAYYDVKDPVYDLIWEAAEAWAAQTGWRP